MQAITVGYTVAVRAWMSTHRPCRQIKSMSKAVDAYIATIKISDQIPRSHFVAPKTAVKTRPVYRIT